MMRARVLMGMFGKPFDAGELLAMIEGHLKGHGKTMKHSNKKVVEYIEMGVKVIELSKSAESTSAFPVCLPFWLRLKKRCRRGKIGCWFLQFECL